MPSVKTKPRSNISEVISVDENNISNENNVSKGIIVNEDVPWHWDDQCQTAFDELKNILISKPVLQLYDPNKPCHVFVDASQIAVGAVLKQPDESIMSTKNWCLLFLLWFPCLDVLVCLGYEKSLTHNHTSILGTENHNYFADSPVHSSARAVPPSEGSRYLRRRWGPGKKLRNREYLLRLMSDYYEPDWMSEKRPKKFRKPMFLSELNLDVSRHVSAPKQQLPWNQLNLTEELSFFHPELLPRKNQIKSWLIRRASCPVVFTWQDMGADIWPRWLRYGYCLDRKGECSFPAGMACRPVQGAKVDLHVLRWVCRNRKGDLASKKKRKACEWIRVITSVIVDCQCEC
ncbi:uncharacterized protein LOC118204639 [Stegodyphus dumicola]|uniref:uncharacterized protein LOC118204639 n=1 Tax=Stegodyphus dumicola TaxID=202533 RepID=UPI0015A7FE46|nr:uncharacterized protein LOC118204639 [Stegodyphus dumicola]